MKTTMSSGAKKYRDAMIPEDAYISARVKAASGRVLFETGAKFNGTRYERIQVELISKDAKHLIERVVKDMGGSIIWST